MRYRLQHLDRIYRHDPVYFLTLCTDMRKPLLDNPAILEAFRNFCLGAEDRGVHVGRFVIMPDHIHLFVSLSETVKLGDWVKSLKNSLSKALRESGHSSPHWQKGFFDHVLRSEESYEEKWTYVRENPVRAGFTQTWATWPWSGEFTPLDLGSD